MATKTAFSEHEAKAITHVDWYNDATLNDIIINNFVNYNSENLNTTLLDIGCGVATMYRSLKHCVDHYYGVDNSMFMLKIAKQISPDINEENLFLSKIEDIIDKSLFKNKVTHILIKNVMQFLDYDFVFSHIRKNYRKKVVCQLVQTTRRKESKDLFKLLQSLNFVKRTKHYLYKDELTDIINNQGFQIVDYKQYTQNFEMDEWLRYHNVDKKQIYNISKILHKYSNSELHSYNITRKNGRYYLLRLLSIITFVKKDVE